MSTAGLHLKYWLRRPFMRK